MQVHKDLDFVFALDDIQAFFTTLADDPVGATQSAKISTLKYITLFIIYL